MAILVNGVKHACMSCIRGHRVKKCNHNDRTLVPIVKRGRQISQCNHCRDLRKTNHSHVKCTCAIASTPNPINGCLCEVILSCSCVAGHLQEVQEDGSSAYSGSPISNIASSPQLPNDENNINLPSSVNILNPLQESNTVDQIFSPINADESDLMDFLKNDLDKYIT